MQGRAQEKTIGIISYEESWSERCERLRAEAPCPNEGMHEADAYLIGKSPRVIGRGGMAVPGRAIQLPTCAVEACGTICSFAALATSTGNRGCSCSERHCSGRIVG